MARIYERSLNLSRPILRFNDFVLKEGYAIAVPPCDQPQCSHLLSPELASKVLSGIHKPINPHAQRLLTAEARATRALKAEEKKKAQPKPKASAAKKEKEKDDGEEGMTSRTEYTKQKKSFMQGRLACTSCCLWRSAISLHLHSRARPKVEKGSYNKGL